MEDQLHILMSEIVEKIRLLDPDIAGQDDEINQLEKIYTHLNDAHSELLTLILKY